MTTDVDATLADRASREPSLQGDAQPTSATLRCRRCGDTAYVSFSYASAALQAEIEAQQQDKLDAARWRYIRRKLCLTGNGDGTCAMQAINLPANIQGWPEPGQVAEFCDAAIDAAMREAAPKAALDCHHRPPCDECAAYDAQGGK